MLAVGGVFALDDVLRECTSELTSLVNTFNYEAAGLHKSKVDGQVSAGPRNVHHMSLQGPRYVAAVTAVAATLHLDIATC